jgi:hypothetical protein
MGFLLPDAAGCSEMCGQLPRRILSAFDTVLPFFLTAPRRTLYHQSFDLPNPNEWQRNRFGVAEKGDACSGRTI